MSRPPLPHSYWVLNGEFLAGEYPLRLRTPGDRGKQIGRLLDAGIDCFIDLTAEHECPTYDALLPAGVLHLRMPVEDHGLPSDPAQMQEIQATIARQLAGGRRLYVHCRAGIGRTGTVVGCYLVEQGYGGREALAELNRLWQQNSLARTWPEVPETHEQYDYVLDWPRHRRAQTPTLSLAASSPPPREDPELRLVASLRERFQGALLGLAVGDALAAATQFRRPGSFTPVGDLLGGGPHDLPRGGWSDDTAMALCLAESLAERRSYDDGDFLARLLRWQAEGHLSATGQCVGITGPTARALARVQWRSGGAPSGSHDPQQRDPEVLSRVAPAVLHAFADEAAAISLAGDVARVTCQSPVVVDACRLLAAMLHVALRGEPRARVVAPHPAVFTSQPLKSDVAPIAAATRPIPASRDTVRSDVLDALQAALWAFASTQNFRDGALAVVNLGGQSDVAGAVYGQLAGAHYGINAIPAHWRSAILRRADIENLADRLLADALVALGSGFGNGTANGLGSGPATV